METALRSSGFTKELNAIKTKNKSQNRGERMRKRFKTLTLLLCLLALKSEPVLAGIMGNIPSIILFHLSQPNSRPATSFIMTPRHARQKKKKKKGK